MNQYVAIPAIASGTWCAPVASLSDLPTEGNRNGDVRATLDAQTLYQWDDSAWVEVTGGGGGGSNSFTTIVGTAGTNPEATTTTSTLTFTSSDSTVTVTGNSGTDTLDVKAIVPVTSASNVGTGTGQVYKTLTSKDIKLKTIAAGQSISVTNNTDDITLDQAANYSAGNSSTALTVNWNNGAAQHVTLTGNCTFTFSNPRAGSAYVLRLLQDATGSRLVTWPAAVKWTGAIAPTLSTTAAAIDLINFYYDGTSYLGTSAIGF